MELRLEIDLEELKAIKKYQAKFATYTFITFLLPQPHGPLPPSTSVRQQRLPAQDNIFNPSFYPSLKISSP